MCFIELEPFAPFALFGEPEFFKESGESVAVMCFNSGSLYIKYRADQLTNLLCSPLNLSEYLCS